MAIGGGGVKVRRAWPECINEWDVNGNGLACERKSEEVCWLGKGE